jgi:zinc transport system substrate-binding protein
MNKKTLATIILFAVSVGILIFIANDLWNSANDFNKSRQAKKNIASPKTRVVASFYPLYFFSQQIGGDKINISNIDFFKTKPTAQDMDALENSNLIVVNGLDWEFWINDVKNKKAIIVASSGLDENQVIEREENKIDPHIWLSPIIAKQMADSILAGFLQVDSSNAQYYKSNAEKLKLELDKLNAEYKNGLANCQDKNIITSYPAFLYLAKDYGLNQILLSGLSANEELSEQQINNIKSFIEENNAKYIFFETAANSELAKTIEEKTGAKILILNPIERLSAEDIKQGKNYFTEMRNNLSNLKTALQCQ